MRLVTANTVAFTKSDWESIGQKAGWLKTAQSKPEPFAAWKEDLVKAIMAAIKKARAEGTVGMSMDNLRMVTRPPMNGGPTGTNVQYYYKNEWFPEAVAKLPSSYKQFVERLPQLDIQKKVDNGMIAGRSDLGASSKSTVKTAQVAKTTGDHCDGHSKMRAAKVYYDNGDSITTDLAAGLSDEDINNYFAVGRQFNLGYNAKGNANHDEDFMAKVVKVEILK